MPPEEKPTLMQTVDAAIAGATPAPLETPPADDTPPEGEGAAADETKNDDAGDGEAGAGEDAGDSAGDGSGDAGDAERGGDAAEGEADADGEDGDDAAAAAAAAAAGKKPAAGKEPPVDDKGKKPDAPAGPKKPDHINDPIPKDLNDRTRTRMTSLVDTAKTLTKERDAAREENTTFLRAIQETGADPETFARHVEVLRLINSDKPDEQRKAAQMLRTVADRIAKELGDVETGKELEGHDDLAEEVEAGDITRARAIEIATARNREKADAARRERTAAATREKTAEQQAIADGRDELNELEQELLAADPTGYYGKRAQLERALKVVLEDIPPAKWASTYKRMYDNLEKIGLRSPAPKVGDAGARNRAPNGTGVRQPMRPKQGAGAGARPEPKSLAEAIDLGIQQAAR